MMLAVWIGLLLFAVVCGCALMLTAKAQRSVRASRHISMTAYGTYAQAQQDKHDLNLFGLAQQLGRRLGAAASFGLSFQSLGLVGAAFLLAGPALQKGGPSVVSIGLPVLALFGILVSASLAELSSAVPTAGGVYHWASALGTRRWGWYAAWFHLAGHLAMMTLMNGACAFILDKLLSVWLNYNTSWWTTGIVLCFVTAVQAAVNHWGTGRTGALQEAGIMLHAVVLAAIIGGIFIAFGRSVLAEAFIYVPKCKSGRSCDAVGFYRWNASAAEVVSWDGWSRASLGGNKRSADPRALGDLLVIGLYNDRGLRSVHVPDPCSALHCRNSLVQQRRQPAGRRCARRLAGEFFRFARHCSSHLGKREQRASDLLTRNL